MKNRIKLVILVLLTLIAVAVLLMLKRVPQDAAYHLFSDNRRLWGIPNFANVITNCFFIVVGMKGLTLLGKSSAPRSMLWAYGVLFAGIFLTGFGSGYYHWHPNNDRLVWDRLPMALVFMALLSATIGELIDFRAGMYSLAPFLSLGILSVWWWHYTESVGRGDLRLYGFVQFYPVFLIPLILLMFPVRGGNKGVQLLGWVVVWYVVAKLGELFDKQIFLAFRIVSGHSLKHIAAAMATWYLVRMFQEKYVPTNLMKLPNESPPQKLI